MKTSYMILRAELHPPVRSKELATFTWMLHHPSGLEILAAAGIPVPERFELVLHTNPDDPPDFSVFGLGFEVTEFPPNQSALNAVHMERKGRGMEVPAFQRTGRDINKIRAEVNNPTSLTNSMITRFASVNEEAVAYAREFLTILEGPGSKDVPGNDVLLLDQRHSHHTDFALLPAIQAVTSKCRPKHLRLIVMVRANECIKAYP